jgi:NTE family protein
MKFTYLIIAICLYSSSLAQTNPYKNLVLEGGGMRGFAYVGAVEILDSAGILKDIERVAGTSAGAIQATMIAVGYTPAEMEKLIENLPMNQFNDGTIAGGISRLRNYFGFYKGQRLSNWIEELIKNKTGDGKITFRQLHELKNSKGYKDLYLTGSDITYRRLRIFSYETYPDMAIKDAVRISFSIPLYYEPVLMDDEGKILKTKSAKNYHLMVDGGLLSNYPVEIFDSSRYITCDSNNCINRETIGLLLETPEQLEYSLRKSNTAGNINSLTEYVKAIYQTAVDRPNPDREGLKRTIVISDLGVKSRIKKLSAKTTAALVESGREGVRRFLVN